LLAVVVCYTLDCILVSYGIGMTLRASGPAMGLNIAGLSPYFDGYQALDLMKQSDGWR